MNLQLLVISYVSTLISNAIILLGCTSIMVWIREEIKIPWFNRHKELDAVLFAIALIGLVAALSWFNFHIMSSQMSVRRSYINMEIVTLFNMTLINRSRWQLVTTLGATLLFVLIPQTGALGGTFWLQLLALLVLEVLIFHFQQQLIAHPAVLAAVFGLVAWESLAITTVVYGSQPFYSLILQIVALVILQAIVTTYTYFLMHLLRRSQRYERLAKYDELTGLRNFGTFNRDLEHAHQLFKTQQRRYAIYTMDIDKFKHINDTYGHLAGNEVLVGVAGSLHQKICSLEYHGHVYRTGGEEFTVILEDLPASNERAQILARNIQKLVGQLKFSFTDNLIVKLSIGEERVREADDSYLATYKRADQSLYVSKRSGRNAITIHGLTMLKDSQ